MFWFTSSHRKIYLKIALKYGCSPQFVYNIAHGKKSENKKVPDIRQDLIDLGIIFRKEKNR